MKDYSKVYGHDELYRDNTTGAIINTDKRLSPSVTIRQLQDDVNDLKCELSEIKTLLREIAGK